MSTLLTTLTEEKATIRWKEPYVSDGLNRKVFGPIPRGIVRGGNLTTSLSAMTVEILPDSDTGDSVYTFGTADGRQLTIREIGIIPISLNTGGIPGTVVYIGLEVTYVIGSGTVSEWRAYSQAEIDADDKIVIVGRVDVPASGVIPASDITLRRRRDAWQDQSLGLRDWRQITQAGNIDLPVEGLDSDRLFPYWLATKTGSATVEHNSTFQRSLTHSMRFGGTSGFATIAPSAGDGVNSVLYPVRQGQRVFYSFFAMAKTWTFDTTQQVVFKFRDAPSTAGSLTTINKAFANSGTDADWVLVTDMVEAPFDGWMEWLITSQADAANAGYLYLDDIRVWLEAGKALDDQGQAYLMGINRQLSGSVLSLIPAELPDSIETWANSTIRLINTSPADGSAVSAKMTVDPLNAVDLFDFTIEAAVTVKGKTVAPVRAPLRVVPQDALPSVPQTGAVAVVNEAFYGYADSRWEYLSGLAGRPLFNVKDVKYGAVGDGVANDTTAISNAITDAAVNGGIVLFPPGTYEIDTTLTKPDNVDLVGAGANCTTITMDHASNHLIVVAGSTTFGTERIAGLRLTTSQAHGGFLVSVLAGGRVSIERCHLGGSDANGFLASSTGGSNSEMTLKDCYLELGNQNRATQSFGGVETWLTRCTIKSASVSNSLGLVYNNSGARIHVLDCKFLNFAATSGTFACVGLQSGDVNHAEITGCDFGNGGGATVTAIEINGVEESQIHESGNSFGDTITAYDISGVTWNITDDKRVDFGSRRGRTFYDFDVTGSGTHDAKTDYETHVLHSTSTNNKTIGADGFMPPGSDLYVVVWQDDAGGSAIFDFNADFEDNHSVTIANNKFRIFQFKSLYISGDLRWCQVGEVSGDISD